MNTPKNFIEERGSQSIRASKLRYRLLADGTVLDQHDSNKQIGFIYGRDLEEAWHMGGAQRKKFLKERLKLV